MGADIRATVEWVDARERLPEDGMPVAAATSGRYPSGSADAPHPEAGVEFWLVMPMVFSHLHFAEDGSEHHDCFIDSDRLIRLPHGRGDAYPVTHWAYLPTLPGTDEHYLRGGEARAALGDAQS
ncbi:amine oxidase [Streptomyces diacarni]|uniref:Amine oxidase n=1 Tax=Streptomyces diacarni TaxID=2800381 RepID=A0A367F377_9ACTN|nr:AQJ64_40280 family protein [Streptomyces diacarni]RCG24824.1 amine oxidase [Streptomyces diacarni]